MRVVVTSDLHHDRAGHLTAPGEIEALEKEQAELNELLNGSTLYTQGAERMGQVTARAAAIDEELMGLLERWTALSA